LALPLKKERGEQKGDVLGEKVVEKKEESAST
jgi:hypothetical protein